MTYPFEKKISQLIRELSEIQVAQGDVWVEVFAEGCFCGCNVTFVEGTPDTLDFRGQSNDDGSEPYVLIGERVY